MAEAIYLLCAVTSVACAVLLLRGYRRRRTRLLLWSSGCFALLGVNNVLLFVDLVLIPSIDLSLARTMTELLAIVLLLVGFVWEGR